MKNSKIEWTDDTDNPIQTVDGSFYCIKISPGCKFCYAEGQASRISHMRHKAPLAFKVMKDVPELKLNRGMLQGWARKQKPTRRFVSSMTDIFGEFVPDAWCMEILDAMAAAPLQTFQVLSKRARRMCNIIRAWLELRGLDAVPANIWIGTSVEDQERARERLDWLIAIPCSVRWISAEPLLGPLDLTMWLDAFHWLVAGGESGHNARPAHPYWFQSLRDQCFDEGTAFFFKQWGEYHPEHLPGASSRVVRMGADGYIANDIPSTRLDDRPDLVPLYRIGKKNAGHILDGHVWQDFPTV